MRRVLRQAFETALDILETQAQTCKSYVFCCLLFSSLDVQDLFMLFDVCTLDFRSIVFLTDGISENVADLNIDDMSATVFSYTFGNDADTTIPRVLANVSGGIYTHIDDGDDNLLTVMSSYYLSYAHNEGNISNMVTSPYLDFSTGMHMITMALSVYSDGFFIGVLGVDIPLSFLSETIGDVVLPGRKSYSFMVNQEQEVILHPLLTDPLTTLFSVGDEYTPIHISNLEPDELNVTSMMTVDQGSQKIVGDVKVPVCCHTFFR